MTTRQWVIVRFVVATVCISVGTVGVVCDRKWPFYIANLWLGAAIYGALIADGFLP